MFMYLANLIELVFNVYNLFDEGYEMGNSDHGSESQPKTRRIQIGWERSPGIHDLIWNSFLTNFLKTK